MRWQSQFLGLFSSFFFSFPLFPFPHTHTHFIRFLLFYWIECRQKIQLALFVDSRAHVFLSSLISSSPNNNALLLFHPLIPTYVPDSNLIAESECSIEKRKRKGRMIERRFWTDFPFFQICSYLLVSVCVSIWDYHPLLHFLLFFKVFSSRLTGSCFPCYWYTCQCVLSCVQQQF